MEYNIINEQILKEYIRKVVKDTVDEIMLNEMAFDLKTYKERIRNHAIEIAINWCLVRYTFYDEKYTQLRRHWMSELKAQLNSLAIAKVTAKKPSLTKYKMVLAVWAEYEFDRDEYSINGQIANKFEEEGIDIQSENYIKVIDDFKNEATKIADVISSSDRTTVNEYVNNLCS